MLRRNMLQKSEQGHKMQDKWLGPYKTEKKTLKTEHQDTKKNHDTNFQLLNYFLCRVASRF